MPRLAQLYFKTAIIFLIIGLCMGLHMAISQDHAATPAHAHTNLLEHVFVRRSCTLSRHHLFCQRIIDV